MAIPRLGGHGPSLIQRRDPGLELITYKYKVQRQ